MPVSENISAAYRTIQMIVIAGLFGGVASVYGQEKPRPQLPKPDLYLGSSPPVRLVSGRSAPLCEGRQDIAVRIENALGHAGTSQPFTVRLDLHQHPDRFTKTVDGIGPGISPGNASKLVVFDDVDITGAGELLMIVTVDIPNQISETNENNNRKSFRVTVPGRCSP